MIHSKNQPRQQARPTNHLQALRDFSLFQFITTHSQNPVARQVRFICQLGRYIYNLDVRNFLYQKDSNPANRQDKETINGELATLIQIIEIYAERYPERTIRLGGDKEENFKLYQAAMEKYLDKICHLFLVDIEERGVFSETTGNKITVALLLKRKPIPYISIYSIRTLWNSHSRLFGTTITIELFKTFSMRSSVPRPLS
jgi:hypothetical protein